MLAARSEILLLHRATWCFEKLSGYSRSIIVRGSTKDVVPLIGQSPFAFVFQLEGSVEWRPDKADHEGVQINDDRRRIDGRV